MKVLDAGRVLTSFVPTEKKKKKLVNWTSYLICEPCKLFTIASRSQLASVYLKYLFFCVWLTEPEFVVTCIGDGGFDSVHITFYWEV